jgi:hypothetical protein
VERGALAGGDPGKSGTPGVEANYNFIGANIDFAGQTEIITHTSNARIPNRRYSNTADFKAKFLDQRGSTFDAKMSPLDEDDPIQPKIKYDMSTKSRFGAPKILLNDPDSRPVSTRELTPPMTGGFGFSEHHIPGTSTRDNNNLFSMSRLGTIGGSAPRKSIQIPHDINNLLCPSLRNVTKGKDMLGMLASKVLSGHERQTMIGLMKMYNDPNQFALLSNDDQNKKASLFSGLTKYIQTKKELDYRNILKRNKDLAKHYTEEEENRITKHALFYEINKLLVKKNRREAHAERLDKIKKMTQSNALKKSQRIQGISETVDAWIKIAATIAWMKLIRCYQLMEISDNLYHERVLIVDKQKMMNFYRRKLQVYMRKKLIWRLAMKPSKLTQITICKKFRFRIKGIYRFDSKVGHKSDKA